MDSHLNSVSHRRYNPLEDRWILVSPHRNRRPWQGQEEAASEGSLQMYDETCYLCPGNRRAQGRINPNYEEVFVFVNDYSAVVESHGSETATHEVKSHLLRAEAVSGKCLVLAFSPRHDLTLADLSFEHLCRVVCTWTEIYNAYLPSTSSMKRDDMQSPITRELEAKEDYEYMQIFENKGSIMGCSNPHPHGQIWITSSLPTEPKLELGAQMKYRSQHGGAHLLEQYADLEVRLMTRVVYQNADFLVLCPWWATWPFEVMILARTHIRALVEMVDQQQKNLADALSETVRRYDNLFHTRFPYSMGVHQAPLRATEDQLAASWLHIHFYPPLLRSATVRKFLVGFELLAEAQRDITPEQAAERLRACGGPLYRT